MEFTETILCPGCGTAYQGVLQCPQCGQTKEEAMESVRRVEDEENSDDSNADS